MKTILFSIELGKSLNTDEAAAMGAVYQAAALSKGYRVKTFLIKDSNPYPINILFERQNDHAEQKFMDKALFHRHSLYPNRKLITFNRYIDDFTFDIHYGNLTHLSSVDQR
jgi:hypoxia up-regulated 1